MSSSDEQSEVIRSFKQFDKNGNGTISREEMMEGYKDMYGDRMSKQQIEYEVDMIWTKLDLDHSGVIDYTEWSLGTINKTNLITRQKLKKTFDMFDIDKSGKISASELKQILGGLMSTTGG